MSKLEYTNPERPREESTTGFVDAFQCDLSVHQAEALRSSSEALSAAEFKESYRTTYLQHYCTEVMPLREAAWQSFTELLRSDSSRASCFNFGELRRHNYMTFDREVILDCDDGCTEADLVVRATISENAVDQWGDKIKEYCAIRDARLRRGCTVEAKRQELQNFGVEHVQELSITLEAGVVAHQPTTMRRTMDAKKPGVPAVLANSEKFAVFCEQNNLDIVTLEAALGRWLPGGVTYEEYEQIATDLGQLLSLYNMSMPASTDHNDCGANS